MNAHISSMLIDPVEGVEISSILLVNRLPARERLEVPWLVLGDLKGNLLEHSPRSAAQVRHRTAHPVREVIPAKR
jgi:hypothetical protein